MEVQSSNIVSYQRDIKVDVDLDFNSNDLYIESPTEIAGETTQEAGSALRV